MAFICAIFLTLTTVVPANAAYYSGGMSSQKFCVRNPDAASNWINPINAGRNAWNNHSSFPGSITVSSSCSNKILVSAYGDDWLGLYSRNLLGVSTIKLDSTNISNHVYLKQYVFANVVRSTTAHEFGHALRLDHTTSSTNLMSHSRNRNVVISPTTAEVIESNGYY